MRVEIARTRAQVLRAQHLIAAVYNRDYEVVFSDDGYDLEAKIEPWPHAYILGTVDGEPVCCAGLYTRNTYVERFGKVTDQEVDALVHAAGGAPRFDGTRKREITKISVRPEHRGKGYGRFILGCAFSRDFVQVGAPADEPNVVVCCAKHSIWEHLYHAAGIRTRPIKEFPIYKVHELYRSPEDPMDSRVIIPEIDVPECLYERALPGEYEVAP
jgi:hypothetical protein